jgi:hypothetical protein
MLQEIFNEGRKKKSLNLIKLISFRVVLEYADLVIFILEQEVLEACVKKR